MILEEETKEAFGYYPRDLKPQSHRVILVTCDECGKMRELHKRDYRSLCASCSHRGMRSGNYGKHPSEESRRKMCISHTAENNYNWQGGLIERKCQECGAPFFIRKDKVKKGQGWYCSRSCGKIKSKNPNWKGGLVERKCQMCGKLFNAQRWHVERGRGIYCSKSCARKARKHNAKPHMTIPEKIFKTFCKKHNLPFTFVGDGTLWIGKKGRKQLNPDFIEANGKKICVEVMGAYWHSPLLNQNLREGAMLEYRKNHYRRYKWHPIFIWDTDLLRKDAENFLLITFDIIK